MTVVPFFDWTYDTRYQSRSLSSLLAVMYIGTPCISIFFHTKTVLLFLSGIKDNQVLSDWVCYLFRNCVNVLSSNTDENERFSWFVKRIYYSSFVFLFSAKYLNNFSNFRDCLPFSYNVLVLELGTKLQVFLTISVN